MKENKTEMEKATEKPTNLRKWNAIHEKSRNPQLRSQIRFLLYCLKVLLQELKRKTGKQVVLFNTEHRFFI